MDNATLVDLYPSESMLSMLGGSGPQQNAFSPKKQRHNDPMVFLGSDSKKESRATRNPSLSLEAGKITVYGLRIL